MSNEERLKEAREAFEKAKARYRACQNRVASCVQTALDQIAAAGDLLDEDATRRRYREATDACDLMSAVVALAGAQLRELELASIPAETLIEAAKRARPESREEGQ